MKIVIPLAGCGTRLKPHTLTTPKPLMQVAGKTIIDYVLEDITQLNPEEVIFVVGYKKDLIIDYIKQNCKGLNCRFVEQKIQDGDGSAVRVGLDETNLEEDSELYIIFGADTLIDFNLRDMLNKNIGPDALVFTKKVKEPQNYGIVNVDEFSEISQVEEKPEIPKSNLAIIGAYYFKSAQRVKEYLDDFYKKQETQKNEYKIVQVLDRYIKTKEISIKAVKIKEYFDCGRVEVLLDANKYFLAKKSNSNSSKLKGNSVIIPPCYIHESVVLENCAIGPYVSIGKGAYLKDVAIKRSIVHDRVQIKNVVLSDCVIGREAILNFKAKKLSIGEKSQLISE